MVAHSLFASNSPKNNILCIYISKPVYDLYLFIPANSVFDSLQVDTTKIESNY